jgi:hypothetical protein
MDLEQAIADCNKQKHEAIIAAVSDFGRLGYLISGIGFKEGMLEVVCCPPEKKDGNTDFGWVYLGIDKSNGTDKSSQTLLPPDGVQEKTGE